MLTSSVFSGTVLFMASVITSYSIHYTKLYEVFVDALSLAKEAGSLKALNIVLIGVLAKHMDIDKQAFLDAIKRTVPEKTLEVNITAFELGYNV